MKPPSTITLSVVATGHQNGPKSLLIDTGMTRYLVNCGEGTQRILTEHRSKAARIQHVFFSQMSWDHVSGLLGMALTARTAGVKKLTIHGPPKIEDMMHVSRHFADCETTDIVTSSILNEPFVDNAFKVHAFPITTDRTEPDCKRPKSESTSMNSVKTTYAYYFQVIQPRLKIDKDKCRFLNVPRSLFESSAVRVLLDGQNWTLENGTIITPEEVTSPAPFTPNFLILDCPSKTFLTAFERNCEFWKTLNQEVDENGFHSGVSLVVHMVPEGLFDTDEYQQFVCRLDQLIKRCPSAVNDRASDPDPAETPKLQHLIVDGTGCIPPVSGIYSQSTILHHFFDTKVYPLLHDVACESKRLKIAEAISTPLSPSDRFIWAQPQLQYGIRPWNKFSQSKFEGLDESRLLDEAFDPLYVTREEAEAEFVNMRESLAKQVVPYPTDDQSNKDQRVAPEPLPNPMNPALRDLVYPELTFLGTGSSAPNKYRNISGILVQLGPEDYILLDCGEGSFNQLNALYGPEEVTKILRRLRLILITHMHADHHGGVFSIALARQRALQSDSSSEVMSLPVLAPPAFTRWLDVFCELFSYGPIISLYIIPYLYLSPCPPDVRPPLCPLKPDDPSVVDWSQLLESLDLEVHPIKVPHTGTSWAFLLRGQARDNYGLLLKDRRQWSVMYSGDTPECKDLIEAGRDCDLLIHEATMADEHEDLAVKARHSTSGSAMRVGESMGASFILLNHFSQRYGRLPLIDTFRSNAATSFDYMKVTFSDLVRLPYYVPYYKYAFGKHWDIQQAKTEAYSWRKYREAQKLQRTADEAEIEKVQAKLKCN